MNLRDERMSDSVMIFLCIVVRSYNIQYILLNDTTRCTSAFDSKVICLKAAFFRYFMVALTYIFSLSLTPRGAGCFYYVVVQKGADSAPP